jgi:hypothetical protein
MRTLAALLILVAIAASQPAQLCSLVVEALTAIAHLLGI